MINPHKPQQKNRTLIRGGRIVDGSGAPAYHSDLVIEGDIIREIQPRIAADSDLAGSYFDRIIDAEGLTLTPGFIDIHRHNDIAPFMNPNYGELELAQGITSVIGGNCGLAPVPLNEAYREELTDFLEPIIGRIPEELAFADFQAYFSKLAATKPAINTGLLAGLGAIKTAVKGFGSTPFTSDEMREARRLVHSGLDAGAVGVSTGIMYSPEMYTTQDEFIELLATVKRYGRPLTTHIRGEGDSLLRSVDEVLEVAKRAELKLQISHFKATGMKNWGVAMTRAIERIDRARAGGQDVSVDVYPYTAGSTTLLSLIPLSVMEDTIDKTLAKLATSAGQTAFGLELYREHANWDNMVTSIGWERIVISQVDLPENRRFVGRNMADAAELAGYSDPADFLCDLVVTEQAKVGIIVNSMAQGDVDQALLLPYAIVISDALYGKTDHPHPRLYGAMPRVIRDFVIERGLMTLEEAIHKMTGLPAERFGIQDRGLLREGMQADLLLFDPNRFRDTASFEDPVRLAEGMDCVFVNGKLTWSDGRMQQQDAGHVILGN